MKPPTHLEVFLVRPTKYDDDGYALRHLRNVLPSNSLACLGALTTDVAARRALGDTKLSVHLYDESVDRLPLRRLRRLGRRSGVTVVVALVGVQTSQFPRATDLARLLRGYGVTVLIGGFHVSGTLALQPHMPEDFQRLMDAGVSLVKGEVEETWQSILEDVAGGRLRPFYDSLDAKPNLAHAPVPRLDARLERKFVFRHFATIDASRGCPFTCSFCTIINVQGRSMRARSATAIAAAIEHNYATLGTHHYFFTDDDFARNPNWREIFLTLIRLRQDKDIPLRFLMQADALAHRIPDFISLARAAGCFQVFIGMESLNPDSLHDGGKRQNRVADYAALIAAWHDAGILTHVGYIIGFAHDSPASVRDNLRALKETVRPDIASFFMLTPLPGSVDYLRMVESGVPLDADLNRYDTFHPVVDHPAMSRSEWSALYREAWRDFYDAPYMRQQLSRVRGEEHLTLMQMYLWYLSAVRVDNDHPMMSGFFRRKPRVDRRPGTIPDGVWQHARARLADLGRSLNGYAAILRQLHELWRETSAVGVEAAQRGRVASWTTFARMMFGATAGDTTDNRRPDNGLPSTTDRLTIGG